MLKGLLYLYIYLFIMHMYVYFFNVNEIVLLSAFFKAL